MTTNPIMLKKNKTNDIYISYIISVYNGAHTIRAAIESVISQEGKKCECIVIDGGSNDGTQDIVREYSNYLSYFVSEKDTGVYDAWNKGIAQASGEYIGFVGADDQLLPDASLIYSQFLTMNPDVEYLSSKALFGGGSGTVIGRAWKWDQFRKRMTVVHVGSLHKKSLFSSYGLYDPTYKISGDYEFLLRAGDQLKSGFLDRITVEMADGGISNQNITATIKENMRAQYKNKSISPIQSFLWANFAIASYGRRELYKMIKKMKEKIYKVIYQN